MHLKTVGPFLAGLNAQVEAQDIDPTEFTLLQQLRVFQGVVQNFPGWRSILAPGQSLGGPASLIIEHTDLGGVTHLLVAGPSKVFTYNSLTKTLTDITGAAVLTPDRDNPLWSFHFGNVHYIISNTGLYKWTGGNIVKVANAPAARVGGVLASHICLFNTNDGTQHPQRFQWAVEGSDTLWTAQPFNDAGQFDIVETEDEGVGMLPLGDDLVCYMEETIVQMTFIGGNEVFGRRATVKNVGLLSPYAVVDVNGTHFFMGPDTFYRYVGGAVYDDVGLKIKDRVYPQLDRNKVGGIRSVYIRDTREILFTFPSVKSPWDGADTCVIYNVQENDWYGPFPILCSMLGTTTRGTAIVVDDVPDIVDTVGIIVNAYPVGGAAQFRTLFSDDQGGLFEISDVYQDADGDPITRVFETGDLFPGANATDENGAPVAVAPSAVMQTVEVNIELTDQIPLGKFDFYLGHRMRLADPIVWEGPFEIKTAGGSIRLPVRASGRWFRLRGVIPDSQQFQLSFYQIGFVVVGRR